MVTGRAPSARLSDCHEKLSELGFSTTVDRTEEVLFYVDDERKVDETEKEVGFELLQGIVVEDHNLHLFKHNSDWVVSTLPKEDSQDHLF